MADPEDGTAEVDEDAPAEEDAPADEDGGPAAAEDAPATDEDASSDDVPTDDAQVVDDPDEPSREELRERVEQEYDFDDFGPADMVDMSADEWEAAFDDDAWVTGEQLLARVEADLRSRIAQREVFAVLERATNPPRVVAYSDEGYAVVGADGSIEGRGTVLRDVKPSVALASMPEYDVPEDPPDEGLPAPDEVPVAGGDLGNLMLQLVAAALLLCGLVLVGSPLVADLGGATVIAVAAGLAFVGTALFLGLVVANARLSARFRAEEYRDRLRAAGVARGDRPEFLPVEDHEFEDHGSADGAVAEDDVEPDDADEDPDHAERN